MCTASRLERQFATLCLFHAPTGTITHKMITEPNFIIFDLLLVIRALPRWAKLRNNYRRVASESYIAAIRIASVRWRSYLPQKHRISPHRPCVRCAATRIARLAFIHLTFAPHGTAEWLARVDRVGWTLAIGDWRFCPSKALCDYRTDLFLELVRLVK